MIQVTDKSQCCGCTACASACPHGAVSMRPDALGFLYPSVDAGKCVDCGLCVEVCAFNERYDTSLNLPRPEAYAARHKDMREVETSRSGAAFIAISDHVLERGGVVYGAGYADHFRVVHKRAATKEERDEFKGSKYVQSDLTGVFRQVREDLKDGLEVLFSGTPCQTAGLASYVGKKLRRHLLLVDIVCHGVPGPYLWRDYVSYLEERQGSRVCWVDFRDKREYGWAAHHETFKFVNGGGKMSFTYLFYRHVMFRRSCGKCHFCNTRRPSDITLGDFWGWEKAAPDINRDDKGVSLVLVNTEKGLEVFEAVRDRMTVVPARLEDCLQTNLVHPSVISPRRESFERDYARRGFRYVYYKYGNVGPVWRLRQFKSSVARFLKKARRR